MTPIEINGHKWTFNKHLKDSDLWHGNFMCSDGDLVSMEIDNDKDGFTLKCFSGIPASCIFIDKVDFQVFQHKCKLNHKEPFENQCCRIADYLCTLLGLEYCDY